MIETLENVKALSRQHVFVHEIISELRYASWVLWMGYKLLLGGILQHSFHLGAHSPKISDLAHWNRRCLVVGAVPQGLIRRRWLIFNLKHFILGAASILNWISESNAMMRHSHCDCDILHLRMVVSIRKHWATHALLRWVNVYLLEHAILGQFLVIFPVEHRLCVQIRWPACRSLIFRRCEPLRIHAPVCWFRKKPLPWVSPRFKIRPNQSSLHLLAVLPGLRHASSFKIFRCRLLECLHFALQYELILQIFKPCQVWIIVDVVTIFCFGVIKRVWRRGCLGKVVHF